MVVDMGELKILHNTRLMERHIPAQAAKNTKNNIVGVKSKFMAIYISPAINAHISASGILIVEL